MSDATTPAPTIDLTSLEWDVSCECRWHQGDTPATWILHALKPCGCEPTVYTCDPCLRAIRKARTGWYRCNLCGARYLDTPGDSIISQLTVKGGR